MPVITPNIWFDTQALEAAELYVSLFPNSKVVHVLRAGGAAIAVDFVLDGRPVLALNGRQEPGFTDAVSLVVPCETQADVDHYWDALTRGGEEGPCGWLKDRYGVSWQIVPDGLSALLGDPDPAKAGRAMQAMLRMKKLDIAAIRRARDGEALAPTA